MKSRLDEDTRTEEECVADGAERDAAQARSEVLRPARSHRSTLPEGVPGSELLKFAGTISEETLKKMEQVIEGECGRIDYEGW